PRLRRASGFHVLPAKRLPSVSNLKKKRAANSRTVFSRSESGSFIQRQYLLALIRFSDDRRVTLILVFVLLFFLFLVVRVSRRHCISVDHRPIWPARSSSGSSLQQSCPFLV